MTMTVQQVDIQSAKQRLEALRQRIDQARQERARAEATLEHAKAQKAEAMAKLADLGIVTEEALQAELDRLAQEILSGLDEAERLLNTPLTVEVTSGNGVDPF